MSNLFKIRGYLQSIIAALDSVEHGRMPVEHLENVFVDKTETINNLIEAEKRNGKKALPGAV